MAELQFFATEADHAVLVRLLIEEFQATFMLDEVTSLPLPKFNIESEVMTAICRNRFGARLSVVSPRWVHVPPEVSEIKNKHDGVTRFYIRHRYGGPALDFIARIPQSNGPSAWIIPSRFSDFPTYYLGRAEVRRPVELSATLAALRRRVARGGKRTRVVETGKAGPIAMTEALKRYSDGCWLRGGDWHHVPRSET